MDEGSCGETVLVNEGEINEKSRSATVKEGIDV